MSGKKVLKSYSCNYYKTCFPFKELQELVLGSHVDTAFELRAHLWPGWDPNKECFVKQPVFSPALIESLCLDWEPQNQVVALHWTSPTEKLFVLDADLDPAHDPVYAACLKTHPDQDQKLCSNCWLHLLSVGKKLEQQFRDFHECGRFFPSSAAVQPWLPMLWCFSGNRGLHLYVHPALKYQYLDMDARHVIANFVKEVYPIDVEASAHTAHLIRLWFSPHVKTRWCCTPFLVSRETHKNFADFVIFWRREDDTALLPEDEKEMKIRTDIALDVLKQWFNTR